MSTYEISRDGIADLALPLDLDQRVMASWDITTVHTAIDERISTMVDQYGWDGDWSATDIVETILNTMTAQYTTQIEASGGATWQAITPSETSTVLADLTPADVAADIAANQNITTGDNWRVLLWHGANADTSTPPAVTWYPDSVTASSAPVLTWAEIARHLDTDHVERFRNETDTYIATSPDGQCRVEFGLCPDPEGVCAEGEHAGWTVSVEERIDDCWQHIDGPDFYDSADLDDMLARVAEVMPEIRA